MTGRRRRVIVVVVVFLVVSLTVGLGLPLLTSAPDVFFRAAILPFMVLAWHWVISVPVVLVACTLLILSVKKERLWWLSIGAFLLLEVLWVAAALLSSMVPLD